MSYDEHLISMAGGDGEADVLGEIEARADAATEGPWSAEQRTDDEMVYEGEECSLCAAGKPLARSEDYPAEFGHEAYSMHRHAAEPHHIKSPATRVTGNYDYEEGGILRGADVEFIAHARTDIPALLAMVREQQAALERVAALHPRSCEMSGLNCEAVTDDSMSCTMLVCGPCGESWPCPTIAAITATEGA